MRTISYRVEDLNRAVIGIGFVGENEHTQVRIDCTGVFAEYPEATAGLVIMPPYGDAYPKAVTRDGNTVIWEVTDGDLAEEGSGEMQLSFVVGNVIAKSYIGQISVCRSIVASGEEPDPVGDWMTAANAKLAEVNEALEDIPEAIGTAVEDALTEAKESGEFKGDPGYTPQKGIDYFDGQNGISPSVSVETITGGHAVTITDATGDHEFNVMDGAKGDPGTPGHSPVLTASKSGKVTTIYSDGSQLAQISDGADGQGSDVIDDTAGAGDTDKTFSADKLVSEFGTLLSQISELEDDLADKYEKPSTGIPASDLAEGVIPSVPVQDVQVNGTSVLSQGVANVPKAGASVLGVVSVDSNNLGVNVNGSGTLYLNKASDSQVKEGSNQYRPLVPYNQSGVAFYGLAKASGDTTQSSSSNAVGVYTENAKSAISQMIDAPETVSGTTPSITAKAGVRYICGEVSTLSITVPASGIIDVTFESGSTATVLTVTPTKTGVTAIKWANGFDPTSLEANTVYEINIMDGEYGVVGSWT